MLLGVFCCVFLVQFLVFFSPEGSNHALKFHLQSFLAGGNVPCTEDYCRDTVNFVPKVCFAIHMCCGARLLASMCTTAANKPLYLIIQIPHCC